MSLNVLYSYQQSPTHSKLTPSEGRAPEPSDTTFFFKSTPIFTSLKNREKRILYDNKGLNHWVYQQTYKDEVRTKKQNPTQENAQ